jgi:hypothetical protein
MKKIKIKSILISTDNSDPLDESDEMKREQIIFTEPIEIETAIKIEQNNNVLFVLEIDKEVKFLTVDELKRKFQNSESVVSSKALMQRKSTEDEINLISEYINDKNITEHNEDYNYTSYDLDENHILVLVSYVVVNLLSDGKKDVFSLTEKYRIDYGIVSPDNSEISDLDEDISEITDLL